MGIGVVDGLTRGVGPRTTFPKRPVANMEGINTALEALGKCNAQHPI